MIPANLEPVLSHWACKLCVSDEAPSLSMEEVLGLTKRQNHLSEFCTNKLKRDQEMTQKIIT